MGRSTTRCVKAGELAKALKPLADMVVRIRNGTDVYPGVYVMREGGTDHVDVGSPYPVREHLAELDRKIRKMDGRPPKRNRPVWILIRRYEWEDQAQQTEYCDTFAFGSFAGACEKAQSLLRLDLKNYGDGVTANPKQEVIDMLTAFKSQFPSHLVQLTDSDNVVYELYRREVRK